MKMKNKLLVLTLLIFPFVLQAQNFIPFQGIALDGSGKALSSKKIGIKISILKDNASGTVSYAESHAPTTDNNGLFQVNIGSGSALTNTFAAIDWSTLNYFLKLEMDVNGGTSYTLISTTQMGFVPFAFYAKNGGTGNTSNLQNQITNLNTSLSYILNGIYDVQGNKYSAIQIGDQLWSQSNLITTKFQNGDEIPESKNYVEWLNYFNQGKPTYCYFNYDSSNKNSYGILYNWFAIKDLRLLAPKGFRSPTYEDFEKLVLLLGGFSVAGGSLKSSISWNSPNQLNTNRTEFNALASGYMDDIGRFNFLKERVSFWSISESGSNYSKGIGLTNTGIEVSNGIIPKIGGCYIRVIKE